jgi:hypothetical protein
VLEAYGWIGIAVLAAQAAYMTTAFGLGGLLLVRAQRARDPLQALLGLQLLLAMGVGYLLLAAAAVLDRFAPERSVAGIAALMGVGYLSTIVGLIATLVFNHRVFRAGRAFGHAMVWSIGGLMVIGWLAFGVVERFDPGFRGTWFFIMLYGIVAANLWVAWEPLRYWVGARRRLALGLADPLVVDRFLLWGLGSLARTTMALSGPIADRVMPMLGADSQLLVSALVLCAASGLGLFASISYWLTFFPTRAYVRFVERRAAFGF